MAPIGLGWFTFIVGAALFGCALGCRAPAKPFITSSGAISTCRSDGDCPTMHECRLLWLGFKVCCPLPYTPLDKTVDAFSAAEGEVHEPGPAETSEAVPNEKGANGDGSDIVRYYYVYVAASTPAPVGPGPDKPPNPRPPVAIDKIQLLDPKPAPAPAPIPAPAPAPMAKAQDHHHQHGHRIVKEPPRYPMPHGYSPLAYSSEAAGIPYNYAPFSTSMFDVYGLGVGIRKPAYPQPRESVPPVTTFLNPYHYGSFSYLRPGVSKKD